MTTNSLQQERVTYTAGPWGVGELDRNEQRQVLSADGGLVAVCGHSCVQALVAPMEANARLIAAAPRLLDALNGMVGLIQLIQAREPDLMSSHRVVEALAAIEEAEGGR